MSTGRKPFELSPSDLSEATRLHRQHSLKEVAKQMGISVDILRRAMIKKGTAMRPRSSTPWRGRAKRGNAAVERRRLEIDRLLRTGMSPAQVADRLKLSLDKVMADIRSIQEDG